MNPDELLRGCIAFTDDESQWLTPTERDPIALVLREAFAQA